jgi:hypothetical protein
MESPIVSIVKPSFKLCIRYYLGAAPRGAELTKAPWWGYITPRYAYEFWLPTEHVVDEPRIVVPDRARAYHTEFYLFENKLLEDEEIARMQGDAFIGTGSLDSVLMCEFWDNTGDDGHIENSLLSLVFVNDSLLRSTMDDLKKEYGHTRGDGYFYRWALEVLTRDK